VRRGNVRATREGCFDLLPQPRSVRVFARAPTCMHRDRPIIPSRARSPQLSRADSAARHASSGNPDRRTLGRRARSGNARSSNAWAFDGSCTTRELCSSRCRSGECVGSAAFAPF